MIEPPGSGPGAAVTGCASRAARAMVRKIFLSYASAERDQSSWRSHHAGNNEQESHRGHRQMLESSRSSMTMVFSASGGLPSPRISARSVVLSRHATGEDELHRLTVGKSAVLNSAFSDASRLVSLKHLAREQLQISGILIALCQHQRHSHGCRDRDSIVITCTRRPGQD